MRVNAIDEEHRF